MAVISTNYAIPVNSLIIKKIHLNEILPAVFDSWNIPDQMVVFEYCKSLIEIQEYEVYLFGRLYQRIV